MIIAIDEIKLTQAISTATAKEIFLGTAPKYRGMPGLIRKCYFLSEDGMTVGGVYLWASRQDAERVFTDEWRAFVRGKYGADPTLKYLDCPVVVDNLSNEIVSRE
jgi:hypothetical protein